MSKKLKIILALILVMILVIFGLTISNADLEAVKKLVGTRNANINQTYYLGYQDLIKNDGLYCIQRHKKLKSKETAFLLTRYVEIDGKQAKVYTSNTQSEPKIVTNDLNAQVAYILNQRQGYGTSSNPTSAQTALWHIVNDWTYNLFGDTTFSWPANSQEPANDVSQRAVEYAQSIGNATTAENANAQATLINRTDASKVSAVFVDDGYTRIGPFKWEFANNKLDNIVVTGDNGVINSNDVRFVKYIGTTPVGVNPSDILSGEDFYIDIRYTSGATKITKLSLTANSDAAQKQICTAKIWFFESTYMQNLIYVDVNTQPGQPLTNEANYDIPLTFEFKIKKVDDRDTSKPLKGVGFKFKANVLRYVNSQWTWVERYLSNDLTWNASEENAGIFYTDDDGNISKSVFADIMENDTLTAVEVSNPYYGYPLGTEYPVRKGETQIIQLQNHQKYVKLSGYVWLDIDEGKTTVRNDKYDSDWESGFNGIKVYLKDRNGNTIKTTETSELGLYSEIEGGEYQFEEVDLDELQQQNYYIEFEYCGITYQSVIPNLDADNGSKAIDTSTRNVLDSKFTSVDGNGTQSLNINDVTVNYNNISEHQSKIASHTGCDVYARTNEAGLDIYSKFEPTSGEIRNINLGLYEKGQTDYALAQDLYNVRVSVNGYSHIYRYGSVRYTDSGENINEESSWNVGVKFQNNQGTYRRAIYESDAYYEAANHRDNELKVFVTYKITLKNESSYLARINQITDYYDSRFNLLAIGTAIDDNDSISGNINYNAQGYNNDYSKCDIDVNATLNPSEGTDIYIQFQLERQAVLEIINNGELLNNVAEITSYTTFKDNNVNTTLSVVDKDSVPGNAIPGNTDTYEDDTDSARSLQLELKNARDLTGTVFVDSTGKDGNVYSGEERLGNGIYDNGETTLSGVTVKLRETGKDDSSYDGERIEMETTTDENGNFTFTGYIPGKYTLTYTWGNKEYKVQYYKGTIYDSSRDQNNTSWYKEDVDTRKTDALDNLNTRYQIDNEIEQITKNTIDSEINAAYDGQESTIKTLTMDSTTPAMEFGVEYETTITDGNKDEVKFTIRNVDFGIVERAKQQIDISKRVSAFKITLANGQVLVDATVTEDGKLEGQHDYVSYMGPTNNNGNYSNGLIRVEIDTELLEGATVEITYEIKATNVGELDYDSDRYYYYGDKTNAEPVKVSVTQLLDYADSTVNVTDDKWEEKDISALQDVNASQKDNTEYLNTVNTYYSDLEQKELAYGESTQTTFNVSKLLSSETDIEFDNRVEITEITKKNTNISGAPVTVRWSGEQSFFDFGDSEKFVIIPSTGQDKDYTLPIIIGLIAAAVLATGIVIIKKKVLGNK